MRKKLIWQSYLALLVCCTSQSSPPATPLQKLLDHFPGPVSYFPRHELDHSRNANNSGGIRGIGEECEIPTTGEVTILVLPVIIDEGQTPPASRDTAEELDAYLFGTAEGRVTLTSYYTEASNSLLTVTGDVQEWKTISHSAAATNVTDGSEYTESADPIVQQALEAFDDEVDFSEYDSNSDGCIDFVMVVHSGDDQAITRDPQNIWSHFEWYSPDARQNFDSTTLYGGSIVSVHTPIGIYAHEFAHNLGLPDLYSYGPPNKSMVGDWSLMDLGTWTGATGEKGYNPTGIDAFGLTLLGWANVTTFSGASGVETDVGVLESRTGAQDVLKIPLGQLTTAGDHYLLVESRRNADDLSVEPGEGGNDDYLPASGVLIWEIDENGANYDGSVRQMVALADSHPNEEVRGISPQALLADAPFEPKPADAALDGASSRFEARGVRLVVDSRESNGYSVTVTQDTEARAELKAQLVRVTQDPHDIGDTLSVRVDVTNVGSAVASGVSVTMAAVPGNPWDEELVQSVGSSPHNLSPGETESFEWNMTTATAGHIELFARISSTGAPDVSLHTKGYIDGKISTFEIADRIRMGQRVAANAQRSWDWEYSNCVRSQNINNVGYTYATVEDCRPVSGEVCNTRTGDLLTNCLTVCNSTCAQYDYNGWYEDLNSDPGWVDLDSEHPNTAACYRGGGYNTCRGEVTRLWIRDFDGDGENDVLVAYRDIIQEAWCAAHVSTGSACSGDVNPLGLSYLSLYKYQDEGGLGDPIWEFNPAESLSSYPTYSSGLEYQVYGCQGGLGISANVIDLPGKPNSIMISGMCGSASVIFSPSGTTGTLLAGLYPVSRPYGGDEIGFSANLVLAQGANWDDFDGDNVTNFIVMPSNVLHGEHLQVYHSESPALAWPTFSAGDNIETLFATEITAANLSTLHGQTSPFTEWYQSQPGDAWTFLAPRAFLSDVTGDSFPELIFADGNGRNTGRLVAFTQAPEADKQVVKIREHWGNGKSGLLALDWDGDGIDEIIVGDNGENAIHVFKYVEGTASYEEIFWDSFGGYTGTGYNPGIAVGDIDGDDTPNMVLAMGGHCSRPMVGDGVYAYGYGMILHIPDLNNNGITDDDEDEDSMGAFAIATGDLNGDGSEEVVVGTQSGDVIVLEHGLKDSETPTVEAVP